MRKKKNKTENEESKDIFYTGEFCHTDVGDYELYTETKDGKLFWVDVVDYFGFYYFTFDKKTIYSIYSDDVPYKLSDEELIIFKKEAPYWWEWLHVDEELKKMKRTIKVK